MRLILCILLSSLCCLRAEDRPAEPSAVDETGETVRQQNLALAQKNYPDLPLDVLEQFYREHAPDLLTEWLRRCQAHPEHAYPYLELMLKRFQEIIALKERQPDEYERQIRQLRTESEIRTLARKIRDLKGNPARAQEHQECKAQLQALMERSFDEAQARQQLQITRLESELKSLRSLAEDRAANRKIILAQKFMLLTGEALPE
ncbi:MAG: hypothetical protein IJJ33_18400 [Victivallales bacterium]|nr:hypothetical protein [Victivallales bacterium]